MMQNACTVQTLVSKHSVIFWQVTHQLLVLLRLNNNLHALLMAKIMYDRMKLMCQLIAKLLQHHDAAYKDRCELPQLLELVQQCMLHSSLQ